MVRPQRPVLDRPPLVLESRAEILSLAPVLQALAAQCEQAGAMHWLPYFLDPAVLGYRSPRLVLFLRRDAVSSPDLCVSDVEAAALFFEYRFLCVPTGVLATGDAVGFSSVIAPADRRGRFAAAGARELTRRGAVAVLATYGEGREPELKDTSMPQVRWAARQRSVGRMLPLRGTLDQTLAQMGKSTRFNLRYYRRRLEKQIACEFVADAGPLLADTDLPALNAGSLNPIPGAEFERRVRAACTLPGSYLCGLRDADGRWLSLTGGWRQGFTTVLHWQMNVAGMEKHSLGTVMRSYLLEHEIERGAEQLLIYGGTPHTMRHAFQQDTIADLIVMRPGLRGRAVQAAARWIGAISGKVRENFVARALCDPELSWNVGVPEQGDLSGGLLKVAQPRQAASI